jgi:hypothetical protein
MKIFMHRIVVYPCYLLSFPFKVPDGLIYMFPSAETYPRFLSLSLEISIYVPKSGRIKKKGKVHACTGTEALYRLYGP